MQRLYEWARTQPPRALCIKNGFRRTLQFRPSAVGGPAAIYIEPVNPAGAADIISAALAEPERWRDAGLQNALRFFDGYLSLFRIHDASISGTNVLQDAYLCDCNRLFAKVTGRTLGRWDRLLKKIYRLEKWVMNPRYTFFQIASRIWR